MSEAGEVYNANGKCPTCGRNNRNAEKEYREVKKIILTMINLLPEGFRRELCEALAKGECDC